LGCIARGSARDTAVTSPPSANFCHFAALEKHAHLRQAIAVPSDVRVGGRISERCGITCGDA